jgi:hypothetical protein
MIGITNRFSESDGYQERDRSYDLPADYFKAHMDMEAIAKLVGRNGPSAISGTGYSLLIKKIVPRLLDLEKVLQRSGRSDSTAGAYEIRAVIKG